MNQVNLLGVHRFQRPLNDFKCPLPVVRRHFAHKENLVANFRQELADVFLSATVGGRCVPISDTEFHRSLHQRDCFLLAKPCPDWSETEPKHRHFNTCATEDSLGHFAFGSSETSLRKV